MELSKSTRISKLQENIARGVVWTFAGLTIIILVWIVGYILFRGFYSEQYPVYAVLPIEEEVFPVDCDQSEGFKVIVNKKVELNDLTWDQLHTIYTKRRRENWGFYTQQDIKVQPYAFQAESSAFADSAAEVLILDSDDWSKYTTFISSPEEMVESVRNTPGAIGYIPAEYDGPLRGVKQIDIRRFSIIFSPETLEVMNNKKMQELDKQKLQAIFQGDAENWLEVGGIDLEIKPLIFEYCDSFMEGFQKEYFDGPIRAAGFPIYMDDIEAYLEQVASIPGSVGVAPYDLVKTRELPTVPVVRKETGINLTWSFLFAAPSRSGAWGGISYIIINTFVLIFFTLAFSTPIGVAAAIYLVEYAKQGPFVRILRMGTETLAGIPSIVFGLFGRIFFVQILGMGIGFLSSTLTITLMILPTIVRTSEEAMAAVPQTYREGSLALGATKLETIVKVVLPAASPGILTGVILGVGRVVGETAVLLYTLGSSYELVSGPSSPARVLALHLYLLFAEAVSFDRAFATGAVLVFIILIVNYTTTKLIGRMNKMAGK